MQTLWRLIEVALLAAVLGFGMLAFVQGLAPPMRATFDRIR